jgi:hypothetical protein
MPIVTGGSGGYVFSLLSQFVMKYRSLACSKGANRQWVVRFPGFGSFFSHKRSEKKILIPSPLENSRT